MDGNVPSSRKNIFWSDFLTFWHAAWQTGPYSADADDEDNPITLRDRRSLINVEHLFGLPIWKLALYKKSRSVTRYVDEALHSVPSSRAERHLLPGNIFWVIAFGWWLSLVCWYLVWPFGKYVEGEADEEDEEDEEDEPGKRESGRPIPSPRLWGAGSGRGAACMCTRRWCGARRRPQSSLPPPTMGTSKQEEGGEGRGNVRLGGEMQERCAGTRFKRLPPPVLSHPPQKYPLHSPHRCAVETVGKGLNDSPVVASSSLVVLNKPNSQHPCYHIYKTSVQCTAASCLTPGYRAGIGFFFPNLSALAQWAGRCGSSVYAVDWLGKGRSARVPFTIKSQKKDIPGRVREAESFFIDSLEAWRTKMQFEKMTLIGHSLGGYLSVAYALKYPDRVNKLILLSPTGVPRDPNQTTAPEREITDNPPDSGASSTKSAEPATKRRVDEIHAEQAAAKSLRCARMSALVVLCRRVLPYCPPDGACVHEHG
ncbi:hypothetical protein C8F04DRAFT_1333070 [Mycena alexandri]|uniref:AB hydrolase-1 domain-containing protein n=1 Tax=Mycena alexandri TaxID=1745969 RepID=A0AAD6WQU5_9AGAR|nr:hypothetical protein C8F04DRAFT_1333070 [Mycena alexandri]